MPATDPSVIVSLYVKDLQWKPLKDREFAIVLCCSCAKDSKLAKRELNLVDGREIQERSTLDKLEPPIEYSALDLDDSATDKHPKDFIVWFYSFEDAKGKVLKSIGDFEGVREGPVAIYPYDNEEITLDVSGHFFKSSLSAGGFKVIRAQKLLLLAAVYIDDHLVSFSNLIQVSIDGSAK